MPVHLLIYKFFIYFEEDSFRSRRLYSDVAERVCYSLQDRDTHPVINDKDCCSMEEWLALSRCTKNPGSLELSQTRYGRDHDHHQKLSCLPLSRLSFIMRMWIFCSQL